MKRNVAHAADLPNYLLTVDIMREATNRYAGFGISPSKMAEIKHFVNRQVEMYKERNMWVTQSVHQGRKIEFKGLEILHGPEYAPGTLSIIPVWEYEEEE